MGNPSRWHKFKVWFWTWLAWRLPRGLVYFTIIRVEHEVTADIWPSDERGEPVTLDSAVSRWHALSRKET